MYSMINVTINIINQFDIGYEEYNIVQEIIINLKVNDHNEKQINSFKHL